MPAICRAFFAVSCLAVNNRLLRRITIDTDVLG